MEVINMKFTVAYMTEILGEKMKSRLEIIEAKNENEARQIYCERHPKLEADHIIVEAYRW